MTGKDDNDRPPFDDGDDWIDRDDDDARGPLIDRDDDELFGAKPPPRTPGFPEEREYPEVPDWDDDDIDDPDAIADWNEPPADNDDLNRLAARELDELGDDPYPPEADEPVPPMNTGLDAGSPASTRDFVERDTSDGIDAGHRSAGHRSAGHDSQDWRDRSSADASDDSWSDESEPSMDAYGDRDAGYAARGVARSDLSRGHPSTDAGSKRWPVAMLAIAAVAVVLLAVGGYGVISERSALEAEIRELQSQLATAISPEEARASRDAQQAMEQRNMALEDELNALRSENSELEQAISDMEDRLESQAREAEEAVAAARESAEDAARSSAPETAAEAAGDWFVNFGSYAQAAVAQRWAGRLKVDSGRVLVQDARSGSDTIHRVRVVGLADKSTADRVARQLESEHNLSKLWVGRN